MSLRILVIRRDNIGDLVCTTPLLTALRARHPDAHLAALVNSYNVGVLEGNPDLDAIHSYTKLKHRADGESWWSVLVHRYRMIAALRRASFDYVLLGKSTFDHHGLALARQVRPRHIVGIPPDAGQSAGGITHPVAPAPFAQGHEVEAIMKLGAPLGVDTPPGPARVYASPARVAEWRNRFPALAQPKPWIALHISARQSRRLWAVERFVELARALARGGAGIVLAWAPGGSDDPRHPGDDERAARIATRVGPEVPLIPAKTASLGDLIAVLSQCRGFIGADGGAMHIAAGLALPVVALFEDMPDKIRHWHPWHVPYEIVSSGPDDVAGVTVDQVAQAWARVSSRPK